MRLTPSVPSTSKGLGLSASIFPMRVTTPATGAAQSQDTNTRGASHKEVAVKAYTAQPVPNKDKNAQTASGTTAKWRLTA